MLACFARQNSKTNNSSSNSKLLKKEKQDEIISLKEAKIRCCLKYHDSRG